MKDKNFKDIREGDTVVVDNTIPPDLKRNRPYKVISKGGSLFIGGNSLERYESCHIEIINNKV